MDQPTALREGDHAWPDADAEQHPRISKEVEKLRGRMRRAQMEMRELAAQADTDPSFGVLNRQAFLRAMTRTIKDLPRHESGAHLLHIRPDGLDEICGDECGPAAEQLLADLAWLLRANVRRTDILGRTGECTIGLVLLRTDEDGVAAVTQRLTRQLDRNRRGGDIDLPPLTLSCAVRELEAGRTAEELLAEAEKALAGHNPGAEAA